MIIWPFDPKATGLPVTHREKGAYIMWAGSPYAACMSRGVRREKKIQHESHPDQGVSAVARCCSRRNVIRLQGNLIPLAEGEIHGQA